MGTVNLTRVVSGTNIASATENANQVALEGALNGGIDDANLESSKIVTGSVHFKQDGATANQVYAYDAGDSRWEPATVSTLLAAGTLLGVVQYNPTTVTSVTTNSTTGADIDAANLSLAVTIPAGFTKILVEFQAANENTNSASQFWGLRESTTDIAYAKLTGLGASPNQRFQLKLLVTGLTAGVHTYKWAQKSASGATTVGTTYGTQAVPAGTDPGPALMAIYCVA